MRSRRPGSLEGCGKAEARAAGFRLRVEVPWRGARRREAARTGPASGEGRATRRRRSRTTRGCLRRRRSGCPGTRTGWTSGCSCWWTWCCSWSCTCGRDGLPGIYIQKLTPGLNSEHDLQLLEQRQDCATQELQTLKGPSFLFHIPYSLGD